MEKVAEFQAQVDALKAAAEVDALVAAGMDEGEVLRTATPTDEDILAVFNLAKIGMSKAQWRPAPKMAGAYRRVRSYLLDVGMLPK